MGKALLYNPFLQSMLSMQGVDKSIWDSSVHQDKLVEVRKVRRTEMNGARVQTKQFRRRTRKGHNPLNFCKTSDLSSNYDNKQKARERGRHIRCSAGDM